MNSFLKYLIIAVVILSVVTGIIIFYPKSIELSLKGVMYRLGEDGFEPVTLNIKGRIIKSITRGKKFTGTIDIEGLEIPVPKGQRYLEVPFAHSSLPITYAYYINNVAHNYTVGMLLTDKKWERFTILIENNDNIPDNNTWMNENRLIISAPSNNREEGMSLSKQLLPQEFGIYFE